jgi:ferredoxin-NADP reductase/MOSC domain-containing protein YiiM
VAALLSVNVGMPKDVAWQGKTVHTGVWKSPVTGPRMVRTLNVDGDGQGDLNGHGGEQRAVLVYQTQSYEYWQRHFGWDDFEYGQFGENFTVDGLGDDEVCVGDRFRIGEAEFEVTQPRVTCFRVAMRLGTPTLPSLLVAHHRPGFYMRVIAEGLVQAGDEIVRTRTGPHALSVADIDALLYLPGRDPARLKAAVTIPALSPGWQQSFREFLDATDGPPLPGWTGFRRLQVTQVVMESKTVASVHLAGDTLPTPEAGQYLTVRVPGAGDPPPVRSYSLSSDPASGTYRISVKNHGLVSSYLHEHLRVGATLDVAAPRGDFVLTDGDNPVLLISAGIGVTPVMAMLHQLAAQGTAREVWWIHTTRDASQHAFAEESHRLLRSLGRAHEHVFYTTQRRLTPDALTDLSLPADATAYICGPQSFMTGIRDALVGIGLDAGQVHSELFGTLAPINPGVTTVTLTPPHQPPGPPATGPQVTFARSGLTVRSAGGSLLELAEACDVPTRWSCRTGVCHTCVTPVLSGTVEYEPLPLEPPDPGQVLVCCAQPETDVVLDM